MPANRSTRCVLCALCSVAIDLGAPGSVFTTNYTGYSTWTGTSFAAPIVSGIAAALKSAGFRFGRDLTPQQLKSLLMTTVTKYDALAGLSVTGGVVNMEKAMARLWAMGPLM